MKIQGVALQGTRVEDALTGSASFSYTGTDQTWAVPRGVDEITVTVNGASGGNANVATGGTGASVTTTIPVTLGDTLKIVVGAKGDDGVNSGTTNVTCPYGGGGSGGRGGGNSGVYSGAAGGGYSGIFKNNTISVANALIVAGGGGGATTWQGQNANGGAAGTSGNASDGVSNTIEVYGHTAGYGATTSANGAAGTPFDAQAVNPAAGTQLIGGAGGQITEPTWSGAGGGGAGYYSGGGGSGGGSAIGGGGGGTSYILNGSGTSYSTNTGNGSITITY
jgi:hypothetical protein